MTIGSRLVEARGDGTGGRILGRLLAEVAGGACRLVPFSALDTDEARAVVGRHGEMGIGLADASLVGRSRRLAALDLLTLDQRRFRIHRGHGDRRFRTLPSDL